MLIRQLEQVRLRGFSRSLIILIIIQLFNRQTISSSSDSSSQTRTTSQLISQANSLLASGQASKALELYDQALERDPDDYLTIYKKATTQMSLGHLKHASQSFQRVLDLKDFHRARIQLSKINLSQGDYQATRSTLSRSDQQDGSSSSSKGEKDEIEKIYEDLEKVENHHRQAVKHQKAKRWDRCADESSQAIKISPMSLELRRIRANCNLVQAHLQESVGDLSRIAQLSPNSATDSIRLSTVSYIYLSDPLEKALQPIKQCLHSDPESKPCKKFFRSFKGLDKDLKKMKNFMDSNGFRSSLKILRGTKGNRQEGLIHRTEELIKLSGSIDGLRAIGIDELIIPSELKDLESHSILLKNLYSSTCRSLVELEETVTSSSSSSEDDYCGRLLGLDGEDPWGLTAKADKLLKSEDWEDALRLLRDANERTGEESKTILERLKRAQKGLKLSKQKDYYKVLGVPRNVDERALKKAYRKATLKAHPDKGGSQAKMTALNEAYEVLSNPELRARYDNGDDPNDPQSGGSNPFFQGGSGGNFHPIFQQFFQQASSGQSGGQTYSFKFG
ncbi:hypothetical protein BY996DRAFT_4587253 [Phakopsora pachyrhizi]|nr:hypothetical protein BY996DRAFT_4587253 [Phakopsora pachyrhizi]